MNPQSSSVRLLLLALLGATTAVGQVVERKTLSADGARVVLDAALAVVKSRHTTGAVAVVDDGGHLLTLVRADGTFAAAAEIATGKARTAALFRKPTSVFEKLINEGRFAMTALDVLTPLQGGIPLVVGGEVVGAVGVSGAASAKEDEEIATLAAAALSTPRAADPPGANVVFVAKDRVVDAFRRGAPLLETGSFKIHASHRDKAGQAEVHADETDIVYVVAGAATLVTGGTVVDAKPVAPGEIRGAAIDGGEVRALTPGDVVVVPAGVPHWFRDVPGPFDYYVVKVIRCEGGAQ